METHGSWPDFETAKAILMSGAKDLNYNSLLQGAGSVNANRAVDIASGADGSYVTPSDWIAGSLAWRRAPGLHQHHEARRDRRSVVRDPQPE